MFDLNKIPTLEEEVLVQDLASLFNMVQDLPNYYPRASNRISSGQARMSWLPPHTATFSEAPAAGVMNTTTTVWRSSSTAPSYFATATTPGRTSTTAPESLFFKHGRVVEVWSSHAAGGRLQSVDQNQTIPYQTTTDMDCPGDCQDVSDGESDCYMPRNYHDNYSKGRSAVRLVELESSPNDSPVPKPDVPMESFQQLGVSLKAPDTSTFMWSAEKLPSKEDHLAEEKQRRELAFNAAFKFGTHRCTPTAPCRSCLDFCKAPLPESHVGQLGALYVDDEDRPPVLINMGEDEAAQRKGARHGPKSKSSEYRGVTFYKRTGRWEAHIWHEAAQVYLGASATKEEAARAYDKAALILYGPDVDINFKPESYQLEMAYLYKLSKEQLVIYLRRDSRGYGAQATYPGVKHVKNHYQAMYGANLLGTYSTEEEAARTIYKEAVRNSFGALASLILDTHHVRNMPSFAAQRFAALYPEAVETVQLRNQTKASASKRTSASRRQSNSPSSPQKKRSTRTATEPNNDPSSAPAAASASAASLDPGEEEQLPGVQMANLKRLQFSVGQLKTVPVSIQGIEFLNSINKNINVPPAARIHGRTWGSHLAHRRRRRHSACIKHTSQTPPSPKSCPHLHSEVNSTPAPQQSTWPRNLYPASRTAWSSSQSDNPLSTFSRTDLEPAATSSARHQKLPSTPGSGVASSRPITAAQQAGTVKFKLFNVEISVSEEPGHGGGKVDAHGESAGGHCNRLILPPRKRCKIMGDARPCAFVPCASISTRPAF